MSEETKKVDLPDKKKGEQKPAAASESAPSSAPKAKKKEQSTEPAKDEKSKKTDAPERPSNTSGKKSNVFGVIAGVLALLVLLLFVLASLWGRMNAPKQPPTDPSISQMEELKQLREELRKAREEQFQRPAPPAEQEFRRVAPGEMRVGEPKAPPVVRWIRHGEFLVPVRQMPDGVAGYGETYSRPPSGGALPSESWAKPIAKDGSSSRWVRNERGDWAISVQ
jgi:hypothetical protein